MSHIQQAHDMLAVRLSQILTMFNDGRRLSVEELADEFAVSPRTIQRDLKRLSYLPIKKENGYYALESHCLGKLSFKDIKRFATFSGIQALYPELSDGLVVDILNERVNETMRIKGHTYEDLSDKVDLFNEIASAVVQSLVICFSYKEKEREVKPYKLYNTNGIWYVVGVEGGALKNFSFSKINDLAVTDRVFEKDAEIVRTIAKHRGTWVTQKAFEVVLEVDASVSEYFLRREMLPHQKVLSQHDETLTLSTTVAYDEEILRIVRYWIPHIRIVSPSYLQKKLEEGLKSYLANPQN